MGKIFSYVDTFFTSLHGYFNYNSIFITFISISLLTTFIVFISTSTSYEARLIKAIDMFNNYFVNNPKITEDNLVSFNQKMRGKKIPKELRKQWQQFVLYREKKASEYMSFENCVEIPLRNSKFIRDRKVMNLISYILATMSLLLNLYYSYEVGFAEILQRAFVVPVLILLVNFFVTIFLEFKQSAIVSDLNQNYQYFETNIDKATQTLPDFVDYEVLFEKAEIKKGIPILYQYLQRRAEEEKRELEKARLKNVEHEKFNFDEAGLAGSLVLERAMHEVENYIAERKKYGQDIEQINAEITQEDMAYRETTKEYNRQMQVSKEAFANYKSQLEQETSTISINYLKKQQQMELDRQRNLERTFDAATEKHKNVIDSYQRDLDVIDGYIAKSREALERAMMSEFETYNSKVYDEANKVVEEREKAKYEKLKADLVNLEEQLHNKKQEVEVAYSQNLTLNDQITELSDKVKALDSKRRRKDKDVEFYPQVNTNLPEENDEVVNVVNEVIETQPAVSEPVETQPVVPETVNVQPEETFKVEEPVQETKPVVNPVNSAPSFSYEDYLKSIGQKTSYLDGVDQAVGGTNNQNNMVAETKPVENPIPETDENDDFEWVEDTNLDDSKVDAGEQKESAEESEKIKSTVQTDESDEDSNQGGEDADDMFDWFDEDETQNSEVEKEEEPEDEKEDDAQEKPVEVPHRKAGRPRKILSEEELNKPKRKAGRPRKEHNEEEENKPKRSVGRPKKVVSEEELNKPKRKAGRPRKEHTDEEPKEKRGRGRPKKLTVDDLGENVDYEAYLEVIEDAMARENEIMKKTQKKLEDIKIKSKNRK